VPEEQRNSEISFMLIVTMGVSSPFHNPAPITDQVQEIAAKLFADNGYYSVNELKGNFPTWDEWVFAESLQRYFRQSLPSSWLLTHDDYPAK
jgi:hypothetical protein